MIRKSGDRLPPPASLARRHFMGIIVAGAGRLSTIAISSALLAGKSAYAKHPSGGGGLHCLGRGTLILTARSEVPVQDLASPRHRLCGPDRGLWDYSLHFSARSRLMERERALGTHGRRRRGRRWGIGAGHRPVPSTERVPALIPAPVSRGRALSRSVQPPEASFLFCRSVGHHCRNGFIYNSSP